MYRARAVQIYTRNAAKCLGREGRVGTIAPGKRTHLMVVAGGPANDISAVEHIGTVLKKGVGYDPERSIASTRGMVGIR